MQSAVWADRGAVSGILLLRYLSRLILYGNIWAYLWKSRNGSPARFLLKTGSVSACDALIMPVAPGVRKSIVKWRIFLIKMQRRSAEVLKTIYDSVVDFLFQRDLNHVIPFLIPESVYGILISAVRTDQKDAVKERRGIFADVLFVRRRLVCLRRV